MTAQGTPVGFEEQYALAPDRAAVVRQLIPGTEDWYYYHCRERLDAGDFDAVRQALPTWIRRHGRTNRVIEIENRQALLSYSQNSEQTFEFLRQRLNLTFRHQRVVPGEKSSLPIRLDPTVVSPATLRSVALARHPGTVDGFEDRALAALANTDLDAKQLHSLLRRLQRPDVDNLAALIVRDLGHRESGGFGSLTIHSLLRRPQLEECLQLQPALLQEPKFVNAYLVRLQPGADTPWNIDADSRTAYLARLWEFAQRLSPRFNSLKAHVLYHRLRFDLQQGKPDKQRFLSYIRLPRRGGHAARDHLRRHQQSAEFVNLASEYPTHLPAIGNDDSLVRACLEQFFATEDSYDAYADYLDTDWLKGVLAETKLLLGQGDMERWYSLLNDPARVEALENRVELRFPPTQREYFGANDSVRLEVLTKNVPTLLVKVFAIDSYRYHVEKQREVDATIELDGIVANYERTHTYAEPAMRRVLRTFELPMLRDPGTYVVEFVGNGISSRAVIRKGGLRMVERIAAAGHVVRVYDEAGQHLTDASVWFGGNEYQADNEGEILVPFSTAPGSKQLVLRHRERSSLTDFSHRAESYSLQCHVHVDREAMIAGATARILIRPRLLLAGNPASVRLLQQPKLTIIATDRDGVSTTQEVRNIELVDDRELVHEVHVPQRLASLRVTLGGTIEDLAGKDLSLASDGHTFAINGIDATVETGAALLARTTGGYVVELRGKNGEPQPNRVCHFRFHHRDFRHPVGVSLQTDDSGRITLGSLDGIDRVWLQKDSEFGGDFLLPQSRCRVPGALHGNVGETLRVPYQGQATAPSRAEFTLLGHERDAFEHLALANGFLELRNLAAGDYYLDLHRTGQRIVVRITDGNRDDGYLIGQDRVLEAHRTDPLQVQSVGIDGEQLRIKLSNATPGTRVHVVATRYLPAFDPFRGLVGPRLAPLSATHYERPTSSYHSGRKLGDEYRYVLDRRFASKYPGNMLRRPSLLLNPWAVVDESWNEAIGLGGGAGGKFGGRRGRASPVAAPKTQDERLAAAADPGLFANLDYLSRSSNVLANLQADDDGAIAVALADLGEGQHIHVLALQGQQAIYRQHLRAEVPLQPRARTLARSLDNQQHFVEQRAIEFIAAGQAVELDDARTVQAEIHDSLASIFRLFTTISNDQSLAKFAFVLQWPELSRERKLELYSEHACHELHFFLHQKDRKFFDSVVRPFLAQKARQNVSRRMAAGHGPAPPPRAMGIRAPQRRREDPTGQTTGRRRARGGRSVAARVG